MIEIRSTQLSQAEPAKCVVASGNGRFGGVSAPPRLIAPVSIRNDPTRWWQEDRSSGVQSR
jgi:hypothetical protein